MSKEVRTTATRMSIDPETVPEGMMELTFRIPATEAENVRLGSPVTLVLPEAPALTPDQAQRALRGRYSATNGQQK